MAAWYTVAVMVPKLFYVNLYPCHRVIPSHTDSGLCYGTPLINEMVANKVHAETGKVLMHWACSIAALGTLDPAGD